MKAASQLLLQKWMKIGSVRRKILKKKHRNIINYTPGFYVKHIWVFMSCRKCNKLFSLKY